MILILLAACQDNGLPADTGACTLATRATVDSVQVEIMAPDDPLFGDEAPVVVIVQGGIDTDAVPVAAPKIHPTAGVVQIYLNLPGGSGDDSTPGIDDQRGPLARPALAAVLRWAAGDISDDDGCFIQNRVDMGISDLLLHGQSNGANLAIATLATEDVPRIAGLTAFEPPISAQFITVEFGTQSTAHPDYPMGASTWDAANGLVCPLDYTTLGWNDNLQNSDGIAGAAYFDFGRDGTYTPSTDLAVWGWMVDQERAFSPQLTQGLIDNGVDVPAFMDPAAADAYWLERSASRQVAAFADRWPSVPVLVIGTRQDHISGAPDHAHITGLAHALMQSGSEWVRVNPDAAYMTDALGDAGEWTDHPANTPVEPGDASIAMEPDENQTGGSRNDYVTAAVLEMAERVHAGEWSPDLDARIGATP